MATWVQRIVKLKPKKRGCHLVTDEVRCQCALLAQVGVHGSLTLHCVGCRTEVATFSVGLLHAFGALTLLRGRCWFVRWLYSGLPEP